MPKTLNDAIGCWTVNRDYNSLDVLARFVSQSAQACRRVTMQDDPKKLRRELQVLRARIATLTEVTDNALRRLEEIETTNELV